MNIVVADDLFWPQETVRFALAADPATKHHVVTGVRDPEELRRLPDLGTFGLAFVDLDFRNTSSKSGLFALRLLEQFDVRAVVYAADDEDNRALSLMAAFRFFHPHGLVSKGASSAEIRQAVTVIESGARLDTPAMRRYARPRGLSYIDRLLPRVGDLAIWRALARFTDRRTIALAAQVSPRTLDTFLNDRFDIVAEISEAFHFQAPPATPTPVTPALTAGEARHARLAPLHAFALTHRRFFDDAELEKLLRERDDGRDPPTAGRGPAARR